MPTGIGGIDGIAVAVGVGPLCQHGVPGDEAPHLRVVEPAPHQCQTRITVRPVAARRPVLVGARAAPGARHRLPEGRERQARRHRLARVRHRPLAAQPVEQRRLPVLARRSRGRLILRPAAGTKRPVRSPACRQ